jgi:hypothetical protein
MKYKVKEAINSNVSVTSAIGAPFRGRHMRTRSSVRNSIDSFSPQINMSISESRGYLGEVMQTSQQKELGQLRELGLVGSNKEPM